MDRGQARMDRRELLRHVGVGLAALHGADVLAGEPAMTIAPETGAGEAAAKAQFFEPRLQTRDPKSGQVIIRKEKLDPRKTGIVVVDPWNYHWCLTWAAQTAATAARMNKALDGARKLGMQVIWGPTDVAGMYVGRSQRERALGVPFVSVPAVRDLDLKFSAPQGECHCGPGLPCKMNYGWDGMNPDLVIDAQDLIASGTQELYSLCKALGLTHLIYMGGAVNICLTHKPVGLKFMYEAGVNCSVARDLVEGWSQYDPATGFTPDRGTALEVIDLECSGVPTLNMAEGLRQAGLWNEEWITEPLRLTPWGVWSRPYFFERSVDVSLNSPWLEKVEICYTTGGSEPRPSSIAYNTPVRLTQASVLRAAAFRGGQRVSLASEGYFIRLPPRPPNPNLYVDQLDPVPRRYPYPEFFWHPVLNRSYEQHPLRIRGQVYEKGIGMRAPANVMYELKPEWDRFVALAGVDDMLLDINHGALLAMYPSIIFRIFIDGKLAAESPVMRISQEPWRFDVKIPRGSRKIDLVAVDTGSRNALNLGNWANAGFISR